MSTITMNSRGRGGRRGRGAKRGRKRRFGPTITTVEKVEITPAQIILETSINNFTDEFYQARIQSMTDRPNIVCSPLSVHLIMSMATCGAIGLTTMIMMKRLKLPSELENLSADMNIDCYIPGFHKLIRQLSWSKYNRKSQCNDKMYLANQIFVHEELVKKVQPKFRRTMKNNFKCGCTNIDFTDKENSPIIIEEWCQKQTDAGVKNINVSSVGFDGPPTAVMFISTIYFKCCWKYQFNKLDTEMLPFYVNEYNTINVPTMHQEGEIGYVESVLPNALIITIPYEIEGAQMLIILPKEVDGFTDVESMVKVVHYFPEVELIKCHLYLPKFKIENNCDLWNTVRTLGMAHIFEHHTAVFDGIIKRISIPPLCANEVLQNCCIQVNERGTETDMKNCKIRNIDNRKIEITEEVTQIRVNKPFLYMVKYQNIILFVGRVCNPLE